ncbi:MAG TPA: hypothetical protein VGF86_06905, partial [Candidatus Tumulicola sp.]
LSLEVQKSTAFGHNKWAKAEKAGGDLSKMTDSAQSRRFSLNRSDGPYIKKGNPAWEKPPAERKRRFRSHAL